jgi:hypothetical protein
MVGASGPFTQPIVTGSLAIIVVMFDSFSTVPPPTIYDTSRNAYTLGGTVGMGIPGSLAYDGRGPP